MARMLSTLTWTSTTDGETAAQTRVTGIDLAARTPAKVLPAPKKKVYRAAGVKAPPRRA